VENCRSFLDIYDLVPAIFGAGLAAKRAGCGFEP
jgi:hypothetical protein